MVCFCMSHIQGTSRSQTLLLPACVDDYVGSDNLVRFIEAFVESLDLAAAGFDRALPKATGRPGYDPSDMLKLYIYGYSGSEISGVSAVDVERGRYWNICSLFFATFDLGGVFHQYRPFLEQVGAAQFNELSSSCTMW